MKLIRAHLPNSLSELVSDQDIKKIPDQYVKNAIASYISSKMVYNEGTDFIENYKRERLPQVAFLYIEKEKEIAHLIEALRGANIPDHEKKLIIGLLEKGGTRTATLFKQNEP